MIPDVNYESVPLVTHNPAPLDLGRSLLRAVSPIHIEYLQNMEVGASLTISLISENRLWGLVACHSLGARYIDSNTRDACETIGRLASALIASRAEAGQIRLRDHYRQTHKAIATRLRSEPNMESAITYFSPNLLDFIPAAGCASAIYTDGSLDDVGASSIPGSSQRFGGMVAGEPSRKTGVSV